MEIRRYIEAYRTLTRYFGFILNEKPETIPKQMTLQAIKAAKVLEQDPSYLYKYYLHPDYCQNPAFEEKTTTADFVVTSWLLILAVLLFLSTVLSSDATQFPRVAQYAFLLKQGIA